MINIAICEDEMSSAKKIENEIKQYFSDYGIEHSVSIYNGADELVKVVENLEFNIFFFDIELGRDDGVELARHIRNIYKDALFIFVTNKSERVYEVFELDTFGFVRKDFFEKDFPDIIKRLVKQLKNHINIYEIKTNEDEVYIRENDIVYVERIAGYITITTREKKIKTGYRYLTELPIDLSDEKYFEIYRGLVVNFKYIDYIEGESVYMLNIEKLPVSRRKKQSLKVAYKNYMLKD
ncbi:LytR/AlgR family response regulator transcription factor [Peptostreptococcus faecalis]|uniref:LytR/AlgR family response regulator transcription factor n=1 Tax=Peptostreptococcus faecalis TaxID=2045015 RepID=UPI000C7985D1|nr:LytTR family DNA-binding domain-containing protein [Peptostreptococcus faecalis]